MTDYNEVRKKYEKIIERDWSVGTILEIENGDADVTFVLDRYCFKVTKDFFSAHKESLRDFLDLSPAIHGDLFGALYSEPDDYSAYPVEILKQFAESRNTVVEDLVCALRGLSKREVICNIQKAYTISRVNDSMSQLTYDFRLDGILAFGAYEFLTICKKRAIVQRKNESIAIDFSGEKVQNTVIGDIFTTPKNYRFKRIKELWNLMEEKMSEIAGSFSTRVINNFLYGAAPKVRKQCEDAAYGIYDRQAMIDRHIYNQNWIFRAIKKMIEQQKIGYLQVEGTGRPFMHWYNKLSLELPECTISLDPEEDPPTLEQTRTCYMRCPFQTIFGSRFMAPLSGDDRSPLSHKADFEFTYLKGLFPKSKEYDIRVAHFDDYPVPWKMKDGVVRFPGTENHSFVGTTFHRSRGLMITGSVLPAGDMFRHNKRGVGHLKFFCKRILATYKRNTVIFDMPLNRMLVKPIKNKAKMMNAEITSHMEEYGTGLFYACVEAAVDSTANGIVMGIGLMMREVANGVMPYRLKYSDFPESIYHLREEIMSYALVLGIASIEESNKMESIFRINLPLIIKDLGIQSLPDKSTEVDCLSAEKTYISKNGGIIGSLDTPVSEVVFFDGPSAFEQGKIEYGLARMRRPKLSTTLQKGRNKWKVKEKGKITVEKAYKIMVRLLTTYAKTKVGVMKYMTEKYTISRSTFQAAWKEMLLSPRMNGRPGKVYIWIIE